MSISFRLSTLKVCAVVLSGALCMTSGTPARAAHPYVEFPELVHTADAIFTGTVTKTEARWGPGRAMIFTDVTFEQVTLVHRKASARGDFTQRVVMSFAGGELDGVGVTVSGVPNFTVGERYTLFVLADGQTYANPLVGGTQGLFRVVKDAQTGIEYPLAYGDAGITSVGQSRLQLSPRVEQIAGGALQFAPDEGIQMAPAPQSSDGGGGVATATREVPEKLLSLGEFTAQIKKALEASAPVKRALRGVGVNPIFEKGGDVLPGIPTPIGETGSVVRDEDRGERVPDIDPELQQSWLNLEPLQGAKPLPDVIMSPPATSTPLGALDDGPIGTVAGTALCYCGYHNLFLVMEQVPGDWWSWSHNNSAMWVWNKFMDIYRYVDSDGGVGNNSDNEFVGWPNNSQLKSWYGYNWGGALAMAITWFPSGCPCCQLSQADLMFNPAYSWWQNFDDTLGVGGRILYRPVMMHELGHTWGMQRASCTEDYSYNRLSVMHAYYSDLVEDGWGIHATDTWAIRALYDDQTSIISRVDVGVESYYASSGLSNSTTNASTYFVGDSITVRKITVENMSSSNTSNVRIRLWLSPNDTISTGDYQMGSHWYWGTLGSQSWWTGDLSTTIPDVPTGTYYVGAIVTVNGSSYSTDDLSFNNTTFLFNTIQVKRRPANDLCSNATAVGVPSSTAGTTVDATRDSVPACTVSATSPGVWYKVTGTGHTMTATTCNTGTRFDTKISVYCANCQAPTCVAGNDDAVGAPAACELNGLNLKSSISWCSQRGAEYRILVHGWGGATGNFRLDISDGRSPCAGAVECGGEALGACCAPQLCTVGGTCDTGFPYCNASFDCFCWKTAEGDTACTRSHYCPALTPCPNGTSDCSAGEVCTVDTCCVEPVCSPEDCPTSDAAEGGEFVNRSPRGGETLAPVRKTSPLAVSIGEGSMVGGSIAGDAAGCFIASATECAASGGLYEGDGTNCGTVECNPPGACCMPDGTCIDTTPADCIAQGGDPKGPGTDCGSFTCPPPAGACCPQETCGAEFSICQGDLFPSCNGMFGCGCVQRSDGSIDCVNLFGNCGAPCVNGDADCPEGSICILNTCCNDGGPTCWLAGCAPDGNSAAGSTSSNGVLLGGEGVEPAGSIAGFAGGCLELDQATCAVLTGTYYGDLTSCLDVVCNPTDEACCWRDGGCVDALPEVCLEGGGFPQGTGTSCNDTNLFCPIVVACCLPDGRCADMSEGLCEKNSGVPLPPGALCQGDNDRDGTDDACQTDDACEDCGPGRHWVDRCSAGDDSMPTGALIGIDTNNDCIADTSIRLNGPVHIRRSNPQDVSGFLPGEGAFDRHLDVIDTEIVSMDLVGGGMRLRAGAGLGEGGVLFESYGWIHEQSTDSAFADSYFEVFVELQTAAGGLLYNREPLRVNANIDCLPPDTSYIHPRGSCIPLYTSPFRDTLQPVANLVAANHTTYPCGDPDAGDCFISNPTPYCNFDECCETVCAQIPSCCEEKWHVDCVGLAREICRPREACCLPDFTCRELTLERCREAGGTAQGRNTICSQVECRPLIACCLPEGRCAEMPEEECLASQGVPLPTGVPCQGDTNNNGTDDACEADEPCEDCGPGPHWVVSCVGGIDSMPASALIGLDFEGDCIADLTVRMNGMTFARRSDPMDDSVFFPGTSAVDGHLDVMDTEILAMDAIGGGVVLRAGAGHSVGAAIRRSLGAMVEQPGDPRLVDSFFDVFFEVQLPGGNLAYNQDPLRVKSTIDCIPPDTTYIHPRDCIKLFDTPVPNTGNVVAYLVTADHSTYPACGDPGSGDCFVPHDTPFCENATCCERVCHPDMLPECCDGIWHEECALVAQEVCTVIEACCLRDGRCGDVTPIECRERGGVSQGAGTVCSADLCPQPEACCLPSGGCEMMLQERCQARDGTALGVGTVCEGDNNGNGVDEACEPNNACDECGPGDHWVDGCPGGADTMPSSALIGIDTDMDPNCAVDISLRLTGPVRVWRSAATNHMIDTEIVSMSLSGGGVTLLAGHGNGQGGVLPPSLGAIVEQPATVALADSFFDVFFEVQLGPGIFVYNHAPLRVNSKIDCLPPDTTYIHPRECIPLYDAPPGAGGRVVANLVAADHSIFPDVCGDPATGDCFGTTNDTPFCDDQACCLRVCEVLPHCCDVAWDGGCVEAAFEICPRAEACCLPDGTCANALATDCVQRGGEPQGLGTDCANAVCVQPEACCLADGRCAMLTREQCHALDGVGLGPGTACLQDADDNGVDDACQLDGACDDCGPGAHWIDQCPGGADNMPAAALVGIDRDLDCAQDLSLRLTGPVSVWRSAALDDSVNFPGLSTDPGHLDVIDTEIVSMTLSQSGVTMVAGAGMGFTGPLPPSFGAIVEQSGDPTMGDSFFEVYFEVDFGGGQFARNRVPLRVSAQIDCLPPDASYIHPIDCIPLVDPTGAVVANLVTANHNTYPIDDCVGTRDLSLPRPSYCPGEVKTVRIALTPPGTGVTSILVEDAPPPGWAVGQISDGGVFDSTTGKVKWGPFFAPFPTEIFYDVKPAADKTERSCFRGAIFLDGLAQPICGDDCVDALCCPNMAADTPQGLCTQCPIDCACGACEDHRVEACEMGAFACMWKNGCNDDLAGMTRAAFVWKNGECYCFDDLLGNWVVGACPGPDTGCCATGTDAASPALSASPLKPVAVARLGVLDSAVAATLRAPSDRPDRVGRTRAVTIPIAVTAPEGSTAMALEFVVPDGWKVVGSSDGGQWDAKNRKVKWGPFFEDLSRTFTLTVRPTGKAAKTDAFEGTVSIDGVNLAIERN